MEARRHGRWALGVQHDKGAQGVQAGAGARRWSPRGAGASCDAPNPGCPLTTRQPAEILYVSCYETYT